MSLEEEQEEEEEEEDAPTLLKRMKRIVVAFHSPPLFSILYQQPTTNRVLGIWIPKYFSTPSP